MVTLSDFDRRLTIGDRVREVSLRSGLAAWLPAQTHMGENVGPTPTHVMFVELKDPLPTEPSASDALGSPAPRFPAPLEHRHAGHPARGSRHGTFSMSFSGRVSGANIAGMPSRRFDFRRSLTLFAPRSHSAQQVRGRHEPA